MKHASLFTGIGGFDLASEWVGWDNVFQVENDKFCQKVLTKNFPHVKKYKDIKEFDGTKYRGIIDIISGGDPCQPSSIAGLGKGTKDNRFLWPEMYRIIQEICPPWIINENVSGSIAIGILDIKITNMESTGYTCQTYSIPAESVGALHQRGRVWLIAHNPNFITNSRKSCEVQKSGKKERLQKRDNLQLTGKPVNLWACDSNADSKRFKEQYITSKPKTFSEGLSRYFGFCANAHGNIPENIIKSGIVRMLNGLPKGMDYADRNKRIKALGNAIVPQVAYEFFNAINNINSTEINSFT